MLLAGVKLDSLHASPVNPAIALAVIMQNWAGDNFTSAPIFVGASFAGSALALIFFRFVYQKTTQAIEDMEDEEDEINEDSREEPLMG